MNKKISTIISILLFSLFINNTAYSSSPELDFLMNPTENTYNQYNDEADVYYKNGTDYLNSHKYSQAIDAFIKVLKIQPTNNNARISLSVAYINRGTYFYNELKDTKQAANDYRNAIYFLKYDDGISNTDLCKENLDIALANLNNLFLMEKIGTDKASRLKAGKELRGQGKFREALVEFSNALQNNKSDIKPLADMGDMYSVLQNDKSALKAYRQAVSYDSGNIDLRLKLARALHNTGDIENAVKEYNIALNTPNIQDRNDILTTLETIWVKKLQENPQDAKSHMNLGVVLQKKGDYNGALNEYQYAEAITPDDLTIRLNLGTLYQAMKDYPTAINAYDTILSINPEHLLAHYYKGTALKEAGSLEDAVKEFQFVLSKNPGNKDAKEALFETIKMFPDTGAVTSIFYTFAQNNPTDPLAQYKYALNLHAAGKLDDALVYYNKTITLDPTISDAYLNIANIYKYKKNNYKAIETLQKGMKSASDKSQIKEMLSNLKSESANTRYQTALDYHNKGKYDLAIKEYLALINESEPDSDLYVNLGAAYQASKRYTEAVNAYKKAISIDSKNSTALYYLGTVYSALGRNQEALTYYQKALALDPSNEDIKNAIAQSKKTQNENNLQKGIDLYNKGKYNDALLVFNTLAMKDQANGQLYYYRGMVYDALTKYQLAIADYKLAVKYRPDINYAYYATAVDYDSLKNYAEAKRWYTLFIEKSGTKSDQYTQYAKERVKQI